MLQIKNNKETQTVEIANPVDWMRAIVNQQRQAKQDLHHLMEVCGDTVDWTDRRIQQVEKAYYKLSEGTQYIYERMEAKEEIAEAWVRNKLTAAANAYKTFIQQIWEAIIEQTKKAEVQRLHQATQVARMKDAMAFPVEADVARNQYLTLFQGNVEKWATDHQQKVDGLERERRRDQVRMARLERQLAEAQEEIRKVAVAVPLPQIPTNRSPGAPFPPTAAGPKPPSNTLPGLAMGGTGGDGRGPPRRPRRPTVSPSPSLPPNKDDEDDEDLYERNLPTGRPPPGAKESTEGQLATMLTPDEIARLVGARIAAA